MLCKDIIAVIEKTYPESCALGWDNVGLLAGRDDKDVKQIYVALDADDRAVREAVRLHADMLVTHHPLIFTGMKRVTDRDFTGRRLLSLIRNDISCYAMHTNYDVRKMGDLACERLGLSGASVLEVTGEDGDGKTEGIGRIADMEPVTLFRLCERVRDAFGLDTVRLFGRREETVSRIAICPGSGKSVIGEALSKGADVLITGDIGHHEGIDAVAGGMAVIDAGHYGIEHIFIEDMKRYLEENLKDVAVAAASLRHPFEVL